MKGSEIVKVTLYKADCVLYSVTGRKDKVVITLSGSEGGLEHAEKLAKYLRDHGIPALALGYFKTKHSVKNLNKIELENIKSAIEWLKNSGYEKIGIEGCSKGAEYAAAAAIAFHDLSCVILKIPSWFYSEGMNGTTPSGTSCWSYKGKEIPYTPYKTRKLPAVKEMLKNREYSYPHKHICFKHMSHMMLENCGKAIKWFIKSEKQFPEECARERVIMGQECIKWIEEVW